MAGLALATTAFGAEMALAHPHVWISVSCEFVFDGTGRPIGLRQTWVFDEMYSALAVVGVHRRDIPGALAPLARTIVAASKDQRHFTAVSAGGRPLGLSEPTEIGGEWSKDQKLAVRFRLDFVEPAAGGGQALRVEVHDPDLYADFQFDKAILADGLPLGCQLRLDDGESALPDDPEARSNALINGPLLMLSSGLELTCRGDRPTTP